MTTIIAHIKGPSGGGKTTIGEIIHRKFPFVRNIDTDDVMYRDLPAMYPKAYKKYLAKNNMDLFWDKYFHKGLERILKSYKYVILVGDARIRIDNEYHNLQNIDAEEKYVIDIDEEILMKRRFDRHLRFMADNLDRYYEKAKRKPLCVDLEMWTGERLYWGKTREVHYEDCAKDGYVLQSQEEIVENLRQQVLDMIKE